MTTDLVRDDVYVHLMDMPGNTKEAVTENPDSTYSVFINSRLSQEEQLKAFRHAVKHIDRNDFTNYNVQIIEYQSRSSEEGAIPIPARRYYDELMRLRKERRELQRKIKRDEERIKFLENNLDMYSRAENYYFFGNDL